jgi:hypothetical protein
LVFFIDFLGHKVWLKTEKTFEDDPHLESHALIKAFSRHESLDKDRQFGPNISFASFLLLNKSHKDNLKVINCLMSSSNNHSNFFS